METFAVFHTHGDLFGDLPLVSRPLRPTRPAPTVVDPDDVVDPRTVLAEFYSDAAVADLERALAPEDLTALARTFHEPAWLRQDRDEGSDAQLGFFEPSAWSDEEIRELRAVLLVDALEDLAKALVFDRVSIVDRIAWILADDPDHPFGFGNCAEACGFDAERLRSEVVATLRHMGVWSPGQAVHV